MSCCGLKLHFYVVSQDNTYWCVSVFHPEITSDIDRRIISHDSWQRRTIPQAVSLHLESLNVVFIVGEMGGKDILFDTHTHCGFSKARKGGAVLRAGRVCQKKFNDHTQIFRDDQRVCLFLNTILFVGDGSGKGVSRRTQWILTNPSHADSRHAIHLGTSGESAWTGALTSEGGIETRWRGGRDSQEDLPMSSGLSVLSLMTPLRMGRVVNKIIVTHAARFHIF